MKINVITGEEKLDEGFRRMALGSGLETIADKSADFLAEKFIQVVLKADYLRLENYYGNIYCLSCEFSKINPCFYEAVKRKVREIPENVLLPPRASLVLRGL